MDKLHKILVPIDGSKKSFEALDRALILAGFRHGEVTCLNVIPHVIKGGDLEQKRSTNRSFLIAIFF